MNSVILRLCGPCDGSYDFPGYCGVKIKPIGEVPIENGFTVLGTYDGFIDHRSKKGINFIPVYSNKKFTIYRYYDENFKKCLYIILFHKTKGVAVSISDYSLVSGATTFFDNEESIQVFEKDLVKAINSLNVFERNGNRFEDALKKALNKNPDKYFGNLSLAPLDFHNF